jgi:hypothetical protein
MVECATSVVLSGAPLPPDHITGFGWRQRWEVATEQYSVGLGIGGLTAELVLRTLDGQIHRIFTNRILVAWTVDGKEMWFRASSDVPRALPHQPPTRKR